MILVVMQYLLNKKNGQSETIRDALLKIHKILRSRGSDPKVYIMENECSSYLKEAIKK